MSKKTAMRAIQKRIKDMIPPAGIDHEKLTLQRAYSTLVYEIEKEGLPNEKQQLREAFIRGAVYSTMQRMNSTDNAMDFDQKFEEYYKSNFES